QRLPLCRQKWAASRRQRRHVLWYRNRPHADVGIDSSADFATSNPIVCDRENGQQRRAACALHFESIRSHLLASLDAELKQVISGWEQLDETMRHAIAVQIGPVVCE